MRRGGRTGRSGTKGNFGSDGGWRRRRSGGDWMKRGCGGGWIRRGCDRDCASARVCGLKEQRAGAAMEARREEVEKWTLGQRNKRKEEEEGMKKKGKRVFSHIS